MDTIYRSIVEQPARWIVGFLLVLLGVSALPVWLLESLTPWAQSPDWARTVFQVGGLVLVVVFGVIPIAKWHQDRNEALDARIRRLIDEKPIVVTDRLADGNYEISNIGSSPAVDVWAVLSGESAPLALGSLNAHTTRALASSIGDRLNEPHILIAAARPRPGSPDWRRPFTVTFNAPATDASVRHGFDRNPPVSRLTRDGTITEYLEQERDALLAGLQAFVADVPTTMLFG